MRGANSYIDGQTCRFSETLATREIPVPDACRVTVGSLERRAALGQELKEGDRRG